MRKLYNILFLATLFIALQCSKETVVESPLQINTSEFSNISQTMAEGVGYISYNDGCQVTEAGFCWSRNSNPTVTDITVMSEETPERGIFKATISGLDPSSLYYVRAYAKAGEDVYYGNIVRLQTKDVPTDGWCVIDSTPNVSVTSASAVMQIADDGNNEVLEYGVCYSAIEMPTVEDNVVVAPAGGSGFTADLLNLDQGTTYYIRPYFRTERGIVYGEQKVFKTLNFILSKSVQAGYRSMYLFGQVYMDVDSPTKERGFVWSKEANPTLESEGRLVSGNKGNLVGNYWNLIGGLEKGTTYHFRAYAVNDSGVYYGSDIEFTTLSGDILPGFTIEQMKLVEAGTFDMGNPNTDNEISPVPGKETGWEPVHKVTLTKDYYMSCYQVTNEQMVNFLNIYQPNGNKNWDTEKAIPLCNSNGGSWSFSYSGSRPDMKFVVKKGYSRHAAQNVTWLAADLFMQWLSAELGVKCRLATEAEWEYAARGGKESHGYKYAGSDDYNLVAVVNAKANSPVGTKEPNELGLYDMSGNNFDYCLDDFDQNLYKNSVGTVSVDPLVPRVFNKAKVIRGGSYKHLNYAAVYTRGRCSNEQDCGAHSGFRILMEELPDASKL